MTINYFDKLETLFDGAETLTENEFEEIWDEEVLEGGMTNDESNHEMLATFVNFYCLIEELTVEDYIGIQKEMPDNITVLGVIEFLRNGFGDILTTLEASPEFGEVFPILRKPQQRRENGNFGDGTHSDE